MQIFVRLAALMLFSALAVPSIHAEQSSAADKDQRTESAFRAYKIALAEHLATDPDPRHRMAAAILIKGEATLAAIKRTNPDGLDIEPTLFPLTLDEDELVSSALAQAPDDPLLLWIAATNCPASAASCEPTRALDRLRELQPENAIVWLQSTVTKSSTKARTALNETADHDVVTDDDRLDAIVAATTVNGFEWDAQRLLLDAFLQMPLPEPLLHASDFAEPTQEKAALIAAIGYQMAFVASFYGETTRLCSPEAVDRSGEGRRNLCIAAFENLARRADTAMLETVALGRLIELLPEGEERNAAVEQKQQCYWQIAAYTDLLMPENSKLHEADTAMERQLSALRRHDLNEMTLMRESLTEAGISLEPPEGWTSPYDLGANQR